MQEPEKKFFKALLPAFILLSLIHPPRSLADEIVPIESLTPSAREIADLAGITPLLQDLQTEQRGQLSDSQSLAAVAKRQKLIYLRGKLNALVQAMNLQINSTRGKVDAAIAEADETRALLTERRNRMTHRNSQVNLLSGGITKIVGYSLALSPITDIPTNVLEVFDGSVQSSLTGLALRQERQEAKLEHGIPTILAAFLNSAVPNDGPVQGAEKGAVLAPPGSQGKGRLPTQTGSPGQRASSTTTSTATVSPESIFPQSIWRYFNEAPPSGLKGVSRRQVLIDNWQKSGILARANQAKAKRNLSIELLDQRKAMLSDLKSVIEEMHYGLMQVSDSIVLSYKADPTW